MSPIFSHCDYITSNHSNFSMPPENSYAALTFLKLKLNGINAETNTKGDKISHLPGLISASPDSKFLDTLYSTFPYY